MGNPDWLPNASVSDWQILYRVLEDGKERRHIVEELGISPTAVNQRCAAMHLPAGADVTPQFTGVVKYSTICTSAMFCETSN